jgi:hypothetical protein
LYTGSDPVLVPVLAAVLVELQLQLSGQTELWFHLVNLALENLDVSEDAKMDYLQLTTFGKEGLKLEELHLQPGAAKLQVGLQAYPGLQKGCLERLNTLDLFLLLTWLSNLLSASGTFQPFQLFW